MEQNQNSDQNRFRPPVDVTKKQHKSLHLPDIFHSLFKKPPKKRLMIVAGVSIGVLTLGVAAITLFKPSTPKPNPEPEVTSTYQPPAAPTTVASPLTGVQVSPELAGRAVTAVMIENSIDARPQSGLTDAGVVFEAIAEGGITRFLALFQEAQPSYVGPIRSARPYYVRWAAGFDAAYTHSGGSGEALALIQSLGVKDMDHGQYGEKYFDRVSSRYAPHNVYTSMDRLDQLRESKGYTSSTFTPFKRLDEANLASVAANEKATKINFNISGVLYNTSYSYDAATKTYPRVLAGQPHTDEKSGKQIAPKVVIALTMSYSIHPDGVHSVYQNVGSGKATIFQNGEVVEGKWEKPTDKSSLAIKTTSGEDLALMPGQIWFTAVPDGRVTYTP